METVIEFTNSGLINDFNGLFLIIIIALSMKNNKASYKYSKITPQKKFHLLTLVLNEKMLIKDVFLH